MTKYFLVEEGSSLKITLNRPEIGNAFHHEMILEMTALFKKITAEEKFKTIFLNGIGKHFCTGADLNWMKSASSLSQEENAKQMEDLISMYKAIAACPLPVITFVHGCAYGGGIGLCALSDYVICEDSALFSLSELNYGILPGALTPFLLAKIGRTHFMKLALEANSFKAQAALEMGLVTAIGSEEMAVAKWQQIGELPKLALLNLKKSVQLFSPDYSQAFDQLKYLSADCRSDQESHALMQKFLGKKSELK